jgi:hypothetical protein
MDIKFFKTKRKALTWCNDDWTGLHAIVFFVKEFYHYKNLELIKEVTLEIIQNLLEKKLVIAGDLLEEDIFVPWNMAVDEIKEKIKQEWDNLGRKLIPHEIVWFDITEKGKKEFEYLNSLPELKETDPFYFNDE